LRTEGLLEPGGEASSTGADGKNCDLKSTGLSLYATAATAIGADLKTLAGADGFSRAAVTQQKFSVCVGRLFWTFVAGWQQECPAGIDFPRIRHTNAGVATETNAIATRPAAKMCLKRFITRKSKFSAYTPCRCRGG